MTLVIAAHGYDFVVLGTDSRGTKVDNAGNRTQINFVTKLYTMTDKVGILLFGATEQAVYLLRKFKKTIKDPKETVTKIAENFADFCITYAKKTRDVPTVTMPFFGFIITGLDKSGKKYLPKSYILLSHTGFRLGEVALPYAINGKDIIADYLFIKYYKKNLTLDDICKLVANSFNDTINVDGDVGGDIQMAIIEKDGFRKIRKQDIDTFIKKGIDFNPYQQISITSESLS